jgi:hypothetical protein
MLYVFYAHSYFWCFYNYIFYNATSIFRELCFYISLLHLQHNGVFVFQLLQCFHHSGVLSSNYYIASQLQCNLSFLYSASTFQLQCNFKLVATFGKVSLVQISLFFFSFFFLLFLGFLSLVLFFFVKKN